MTVIYLASAAGPVIVVRQGGGWRALQPREIRNAFCIAADPQRPERVFCGTDGQGVWRSVDAGASWFRAFENLPHTRITSLLVSGAERVSGLGVVYAGTEPSAVFRSENGGETWRECKGLTDLPSSSEWRFPPRPETHHVRWIEADPHTPGRIFTAIEAGALVLSPDGGQTWRDRAPDGPYDTHQLASHLDAPGHLWSAAGDGFFESDDSGGTWRKVEEGLRFRYCWSLALDPSDRKNAVLSAAPGPFQAHGLERAESAIYRRIGDGPWEEVHAGLPETKGTRVYALAADPSGGGVFYAATDGMLLCSSDAGASWSRLPFEWPGKYGGARIHMTVAARI
jgi:photosystem II stability/assembly factor-like uncharacterized protein